MEVETCASVRPTGYEDTDSPKLVSVFLRSTFNIISEPSTNHLISWAKDGKSFVVHDPKRLANEIFPKHFKHNKFSSWQRQINMYNFAKLSRPGQWVFSHPMFQRDQPELMEGIVRKAVRRPDPVDQKSLACQVSTLKRQREELESEVAHLRNQQAEAQARLQQLTTDNTRLSAMLREHEALQAVVASVKQVMSQAPVSAPLDALFDVAVDDACSGMAWSPVVGGGVQPEPSAKRRKTAAVDVLDDALLGLGFATPKASAAAMPFAVPDLMKADKTMGLDALLGMDSTNQATMSWLSDLASEFDSVAAAAGVTVDDIFVSTPSATQASSVPFADHSRALEACVDMCSTPSSGSESDFPFAPTTDSGGDGRVPITDDSPDARRVPSIESGFHLAPADNSLGDNLVPNICCALAEAQQPPYSFLRAPPDDVGDTHGAQTSRAPLTHARPREPARLALAAALVAAATQLSRAPVVAAMTSAAATDNDHDDDQHVPQPLMRHGTRDEQAPSASTATTTTTVTTACPIATASAAHGSASAIDGARLRAIIATAAVASLLAVRRARCVVSSSSSSSLSSTTAMLHAQWVPVVATAAAAVASRLVRVHQRQQQRWRDVGVAGRNEYGYFVVGRGGPSCGGRLRDAKRCAAAVVCRGRQMRV